MLTAPAHGFPGAFVVAAPLPTTNAKTLQTPRYSLTNALPYDLGSQGTLNLIIRLAPNSRERYRPAREIGALPLLSS